MGSADPKGKGKEDGVQPPDQDLRAPGDPALGGDSGPGSQKPTAFVGGSEQKGN